MAKMVGYACHIRLPWLKKAFELLDNNLDEEIYKKELNEYLSFEIDSPTRLRKTREILMNVWYYETDEINYFRTEAKKIIDSYPDYFVPVNLCLLYLAYPVVADVCKFMGRIFNYHDEVTNATLKQKLYDAWGERGTLETTSRRVTLTLKELGILYDSTRTRYGLNKIEVIPYDVIAFLISVAMKLDGNSYYTFVELTEFEVLFPFDFSVAKERLLTDERFVTTHFGGEMTIALKEDLVRRDN